MYLTHITLTVKKTQLLYFVTSLCKVHELIANTTSFSIVLDLILWTTEKIPSAQYLGRLWQYVAMVTKRSLWVRKQFNTVTTMFLLFLVCHAHTKHLPYSTDLKHCNHYAVIIWENI